MKKKTSKKAPSKKSASKKKKAASKPSLGAPSASEVSAVPAQVPMSDLAKQRAEARKELREKINKQFGESSSSIAGDSLARYIPRISTGSFDIDWALGGGWPRGRINMVWGTESGGKTTTLLRTLADAQKRDAVTNRYIKYMSEDMKANAVPMSCAWVDVEGTFDRSWALKHGVDINDLEYSCPVSQEEACSLVEAYCLSGLYDAVFCDSLAAMASEKEVEGEMGDHNVGVGARLNNKMFRKLQSSLNRIAKEGNPVPTVFFVNQVRNKIGVMFGSPDTKPGGKAQEFFTSVVLYLNGQKMEYFDKEKRYPKCIEAHFKVDKNKTHPPKVTGKVQMALVDDPSGADLFRAGQVIESSQVMEVAKKAGIYRESSSPNGWYMFDKFYKRKKDLAAEWVTLEENFKILKGILMTSLLPHQAQDWEISIVQEEEETTEPVVSHEENPEGRGSVDDEQPADGESA